MAEALILPVWMEAYLPDDWEGPADVYIRRQYAAIEARQARDPRADVCDINPLPDAALRRAQRKAVALEFVRQITPIALREKRHIWGRSAEHVGLEAGFMPHG